MRSKPNCLTAHMFLVVIWLVDTRNELDLECIDYHECIVWIQVGNIQFSPVRSLSRVWLFATPWTTAHQSSLSNTNSRSSPKPNSNPLSRWCHPTISSSVVPFSSCPQSFPASGSFQMSQLLASGDQSIGVSASALVFPMNLQGCFPLGLTDLISFQSDYISINFRADSGPWMSFRMLFLPW